jgi:hypothetical protein
LKQLYRVRLRFREIFDTARDRIPAGSRSQGGIAGIRRL